MTTISVATAIVSITETTLRELLSAAEKAKDECVAACVYVGSSVSDVAFAVSLERSPRAQESLGYKVVGIADL